MLEDKIFFQPGDIVTLKQDIPNKPIMLVERKVEMTFKNDKVKTLRGIACRCFTSTGEIQKEIFSTKDLVKLEIKILWIILLNITNVVVKLKK